jgi:hypothetical protein
MPCPHASVNLKPFADATYAEMTPIVESVISGQRPSLI